jgi:hypothetical protein
LVEIKLGPASLGEEFARWLNPAGSRGRFGSREMTGPQRR